MKEYRKQLALFLLALLLLASGWSNPRAAFAEDEVVADTSATSGQVKRDASESDGIPPLPFSKASMDLPRVQASAPESRNTQGDPSDDADSAAENPVRVTTDLSVDSVNQARRRGEKWIEVDLSEQKTYAYEGDRLLKEFIVSTGLPGTPTVQGVFRIWVRVRVQTMSGGNRASGTYYSLPNVEWVQYFYQDYAFHGTYWHNNFGQPMSHGCVNMTNEDAEWLFKWAMPEWDGDRNWLRTNESNATLVYVHE